MQRLGRYVGIALDHRACLAASEPLELVGRSPCLAVPGGDGASQVVPAEVRDARPPPWTTYCVALWQYETMPVLPEAPATNQRPRAARPALQPIGFCIYCGRTDPGSDVRLSDEHTIPFALHGDIELPQASCSICAAAINKHVEQPLLRGPLWAVRQYLGLSSRSRPPTHLPGYLWRKGKQEQVPIPIDEYPPVLSLLAFSEPPLLLHDRQQRCTDGTRGGFWTANLDLDRMDAFIRKYRCERFATPPTNVTQWCRFLAKLSHATMVATLGIECCTPLLREFIVSGNENPFRFVGGYGKPTDKPDYLHEISFEWRGGVEQRRKLLIANVRLFAELGAPCFLVVVGDLPSWETREQAADFWRAPLPNLRLPRQEKPLAKDRRMMLIDYVVGKGSVPDSGRMIDLD